MKKTEEKKTKYEYIKKLREERKKENISLFSVYVPDEIREKLNKVLEPYYIKQIKEIKDYDDLFPLFRRIPKGVRNFERIKKTYESKKNALSNTKL